MIRPCRLAVAAVALAAIVLGLGGCGKKGPIVAPERRLPQAPDGMNAVIAEQAIVVSWSNPRQRVDGTRLRDLSIVRLFRREEPAGAPLKPAMLSGDRVVGYDELARIPLDVPPPAGVQVQGVTVSVTDTSGLAFGRRYVYVTTAEDATGRTSAPSDRLVVMLVAGPVAPTGLDAQAGDREVRLKWEAPASFLDGTPATGEIRYVVLRGVGDGPLAAITPAPVTATTFTDKGVENDTTYRYAIQPLRVTSTRTAIGTASTAVAATPLDTTPPSAPGNLTAIPGSGSVRLAWNPSPEEDVALYVIYRAEGSGGFLRIATLQKITTIYTDADVQSGKTYRYVVTALDRARKANESARSNEVSVVVP